MIIRKPVRAGSWYPGSKSALISELDSMFLHEAGPRKKPLNTDNRSPSKAIAGIISPHAGYACSAPVAAHGFLALAADRKEIDTAILLGNKHTHYGPEISIAGHDAWETPLGRVTVNKELSDKIMSGTDALSKNLNDLIGIDTSAHDNEHSIELQLPFLQYIFPEFSILPIAIGHIPTEESVEFGNYLADVILDNELDAVAVASTDMTHGNYPPFLNHQEVKELDEKAIKPILDLDPKALEEAVRRYRISMCGVGPVKVLLSLVKKMGCNKAELFKYATSGETCGSMNAVVGYASIAFSSK